MFDKKLIEKIIPTLKFNFPYSIDDYSQHMYFENYHKHTCESNHALADSAETYDKYISRIKELDAKCLFSGEHGWQGDHIAAYELSQKVKLKYRHSCEAYWVKDRLEKDNKNCHMMIIAKTATGRKRLNYILSIANIDGFYGRARIDIPLLLNENPDDFIVTSACLAGWKYENADEIWLKVAKHFKDNFFLEVQNHNTDKQKELNKHILELANKYNIQIIAGLDSHYVFPEGAEERNAVLESKDIFYADEEGWYMDFPDAETIIERFQEQSVLSDEEIYRAIMNTNIFVDECEEIVLDKSFKIPNIYHGKNYDERVKIYKKLLNKAYQKEKVHSPERVEGILKEAEEVIESGVVDYFLLNHKLLDCAINEYGGQLTKTSRGSMGSFYTNKLLGSTTLDRFNCEIPIYYPRFLTRDRVLAGSMPDEDFNVAEQEPFVKAAKKLLGEHGCYPLMAIEKFKPKSAWKMYSRINNVDIKTSNDISQCIDEYIRDCKEAGDDAKDIDITEYIPKEYLPIYEKSVKYQGIISNFKVHACGYLLFDGDIREEIGLMSAISANTGRRTICACVQGGYLDGAGYVKDDFLIVDAVSLTYELFKSIGKEVPTFDELKEMVNGDTSTWDIYAKGITCCVNQLEKDKTKQKMMRYKATNIQELSAFIAAIRPGFKSLINKFLDRKEYSTGEPQIDALLEDTAHFMLYQESIMKILSFLGLPMGDTYGVIKAISKKKLVGEKKEHLEKQLKESWKEHFGNLDNFKKVWKVINDAASYSFNSPHSYSMAGDSLYQAWFKAHHTSLFYEVAIAHYQRKENKLKIADLIAEAVSCFDYEKLPFKFRQDNRKVTVNDDTKEITMCLYSIKYMNKTVAQSLYDLRNTDFPTFIDYLKVNPCDSRLTTALIKLNFFSEFGRTQLLLDVYNLYTKYGECKQLNKADCPLDEETMLQYATATDKLYKIHDNAGFIEKLCENIENKDAPISVLLEAQNEFLGYIDYKNPESKNMGVIMNIDTKYSPKLTIYKLDTGVTEVVKMSKKDYGTSDLKANDIIQYNTEQRNKVRMVDGKWQKSLEEFEPWIKNFRRI